MVSSTRKNILKSPSGILIFRNVIDKLSLSVSSKTWCYRWYWISFQFIFTDDFDIRLCFFFFTINRFFLSFLFSCGANCHADLDDSKVIKATSVGPPGESPYVYVLDVHANTAPRELVAMLRRYVDDWLRLSLYPHQRWTKNALFHQSNASWSRQRHCRSCALQDGPNCRKCTIVFDHDICIWSIRIL